MKTTHTHTHTQAWVLGERNSDFKNVLGLLLEKNLDLKIRLVLEI